LSLYNTHEETTMKSLSLLCLSVLCSAAMAQTLVSVKVDKPQVVAGQTVQASVAFDVENSVNCGVRFDWGDGTGQDIKIEDAQKIPLVMSHTYAKAGDYTVAVTPKKVTSRLGCLGKAQSAVVKVSAPVAVAAASAPAAAAPAAPGAPAPAAQTAANACPAGWTLNTKSVNKKTKAFSCTAKPGTAAPEKKLACEGSTGYFENVKKGVIGCQA
jgi:hypothetical protein